MLAMSSADLSALISGITALVVAIAGLVQAFRAHDKATTAQDNVDAHAVIDQATFADHAQAIGQISGKVNGGETPPEVAKVLAPPSAEP